MIQQEAPRCPDELQKRLQEFDSRLRLTFDVRKGLWKIEEQLRTTGAWSFVTYWADGTYPHYTYRPLPHSVDPLKSRLLQLDLQKRGHDLKSYVKELDEQGATERARRLQMGQNMLRDKLARYVSWAKDRAEVVQRKFDKGGRSRAQAINERLSVLRDLGLRSD